MSEEYSILLSKIRLLDTQLGFRLTHKKELILKAVYNAKQPISIKEILNEIKKDNHIAPSMTSVYRILNTLEQFYIVHSIVLPSNNAKYYFFFFDKIQSYLICIKCKKMLRYKEENSLIFLDKILEKEDFNLSNVKIALYGICKECRTRKIKRK